MTREVTREATITVAKMDPPPPWGLWVTVMGRVDGIVGNRVFVDRVWLEDAIARATQRERQGAFDEGGTRTVRTAVQTEGTAPA